MPIHFSDGWGWEHTFPSLGHTEKWNKRQIIQSFPQARVWSKTVSWLLKVYSINKYLLNTCVVLWVSLVAQMVKNLPSMQEAWVQSLGQEEEKGMATHSSILAWEIPWTEEPGGVQSMGSQRLGCDWVANTFPFTFLLCSVMDSQWSLHDVWGMYCSLPHAELISL